MAEPTCKACNDTHVMTITVGFDEREVMCTHCPVPCHECRAGGNGAYCAITPCSCACHGRKVVRTPNEIADALHLECMSWRAEDWRARMRELCREYIAATEEGADG
jgi:hypothetical protein